MTGLLAFGTCALALAAAAYAGAGLLEPLAHWTRAAAAALDALMRLGREGREPGALERRRILTVGAAAAFATGTLLAGPAAGLAASLAAPTGVARVLRARRRAYRGAVERAAPAMAVALADALSGGHSLRRAVAEAGRDLGGPGGSELRRAAAELEAGERTDAAFDSLRARCRSPAIDAIVAASLVHRRSGGDLAGLLRGLAHAFEDEQRIADEARVATAQARFTGLLVVGLPAGGALLAELVSPGFLVGLVRSPLTAWLVAIALALQAGAGLLIRRIGRAPL